VNGHTEVAKLLLAAGADRTAANKQGRSPTDMAKTPALAALLQQGAS
jgi:ankyrin repeat protein